MSYLLPKPEQDDLIRTIKASVRLTSPDPINLGTTHTTFDGLSLNNEDRVMLRAQTDPTENGLYKWLSSTQAFTRTADGQTGLITAATMISVQEGTSADSVWILTADNPIVVGTTPIYFIPVNGPQLDGAAAVVNPQAPNAADNDNITTPYLTIQAAVYALDKILVSPPFRKTVLIAPGSYDETVIVHDPYTSLVGLGSGSYDVAISPTTADMPALVFTNAGDSSVATFLAGGSANYEANIGSLIPILFAPAPTNCEVSNITLRGGGTTGYACLVIGVSVTCSVQFHRSVLTNSSDAFMFWTSRCSIEFLDCPGDTNNGSGYSKIYQTTLKARHSEMGGIRADTLSEIDAQYTKFNNPGGNVLNLRGSSDFGQNEGCEKCILVGNVLSNAANLAMVDSQITGNLTGTNTPITMKRSSIEGTSVVTGCTLSFDGLKTVGSFSIAGGSGSLLDCYFDGALTIDSGAVVSGAGITTTGDLTIGDPVTFRDLFVEGDLTVNGSGNTYFSRAHVSGSCTANGSMITRARGMNIESNFILNDSSDFRIYRGSLQNGAGCLDTSYLTANSVFVGGSVSVDSGAGISFEDTFVKGSIVLYTGGSSCFMKGGYYTGSLNDSDHRLIWTARGLQTFNTLKEAYNSIQKGEIFVWQPDQTKNGEMVDPGTGWTGVYTGIQPAKATCTDGLDLYSSRGPDLVKNNINGYTGALQTPTVWEVTPSGRYGEDVKCLCSDGTFVYAGYEYTGLATTAEGVSVYYANDGTMLRIDTPSTNILADTLDVICNGQIVIFCKSTYIDALDLPITPTSVLKWTYDRTATVRGLWMDGYSVWHVGDRPGAGYDVERIDVTTAASRATVTLPAVSPPVGRAVCGDDDKVYVLTDRVTRSDTGAPATLWCLGKYDLAVLWSADTLEPGSDQRGLCQDERWLYTNCDGGYTHRVSKQNGAVSHRWTGFTAEYRSLTTTGNYLYLGAGNILRKANISMGPKLMWRVEETDAFRVPEFNVVNPLIFK